MKKIRLAIADDHYLFRKGIISLLDRKNLFSIVLEAENGNTLINGLNIISADVLLLDIRMPVMAGNAAIEIIKAKFPDLKVLVLTMHDDEAIISEMIGKGANGFLMKDDSLEAVIEAIFTVYEKDYYYTQRVIKVMEKAADRENRSTKSDNGIDFTRRETEILQLICREYSTKEIAFTLQTGERTVEWHRRNIIQKTNSKNTAGIVFYAVKNRLVE